MNRTVIVRKLIRMSRCPNCKHIKEVSRCVCDHPDCVCNPVNR